MHQYRVTKYNPALRNSSGAFAADEWISFGDIGRTFAGVKLTREEYERVEGAYVRVALAFLREADLTSLSVVELKNARNSALNFAQGSVVSLGQIGDIISRLLRGEFWCRLEAPGGFVHVGWDYYMYLGVPRLCPLAYAQAAEFGLYVEQFRSPYRDSYTGS